MLNCPKIWGDWHEWINYLPRIRFVIYWIGWWMIDRMIGWWILFGILSNTLRSIWKTHCGETQGKVSTNDGFSTSFYMFGSIQMFMFKAFVCLNPQILSLCCYRSSLDPHYKFLDQLKWDKDACSWWNAPFWSLCWQIGKVVPTFLILGPDLHHLTSIKSADFPGRTRHFWTPTSPTFGKSPGSSTATPRGSWPPLSFGSWQAVRGAMAWRRWGWQRAAKAEKMWRSRVFLAKSIVMWVKQINNINKPSPISPIFYRW